MLEATFTCVSDNKNLVGRAIRFTPMDSIQLIQKIQSKFSFSNINIISVEQYNSSDSVIFDVLIDLNLT